MNKGDKIGRWTLLERNKNKKSQAYWECVCDCGRKKRVSQYSMTNGDSRSCGCWSSELISKAQKGHKMSRTRFYVIWAQMKSRCIPSGTRQTKAYGDRGIRVCERWEKFDNFKEDMYVSYQAHVDEFGEKQTTLDRLDSDQNYEPANCRWATWAEQGKNRKDYIGDKKCSLAECDKMQFCRSLCRTHYYRQYERDHRSVRARNNILVAKIIARLEGMKKWVPLGHTAVSPFEYPKSYMDTAYNEALADAITAIRAVDDMGV